MKRLERSDLRTNDEYLVSRNAFRSFVIQVKTMRRIRLGSLFSLVFENQRTLLYELQEYLLAARIEDDAGIEEALKDMNSLIPRDNELRATLFLEGHRRQILEEWIPKLGQIGSCLALGIGDGINVRSVPEAGRTWDTGMSSVQYVKFSFPNTALEAMGRQEPVRLYIDHPDYQKSVDLTPALADDLAHGLTPTAVDPAGKVDGGGGPRIRPYLSVSGVYKSPNPPDDPEGM